MKLKRWSVRTVLALLVLSKAAVTQGSDEAQPLSPPQKVDVVVVGAGLAGLSLAYQLQQQGFSYVLLEATDRLGGRVSTLSYTVNGERVYANEGVEEFWQGNPFVELAKSLGLDLNKENAFSSFVLDGKIHVYQKGESKESFLSRVMSTRELQSLLDLEAKLEDYFSRGLDRSTPLQAEFGLLKYESFANWVKRQEVPKKVADWIRICIEPEMATEWTKVSAVEGIFEYHKFMGSQGRSNFQVVRGTQLLTDALVKEIGQERIFTKTLVQEITDEGERVRIEFKDGAGKTHHIEAGHVVSSIPIRHLLKSVKLSPLPQPQQRLAMETLNQGRYLKLHILLREGAQRLWTRGGQSILPLLTDSPLGVVYEGNPDKGNARTQVITILLHGEKVDALTGLSEGQIKDQVLKHLEHFFPGVRREVLQIEVLSRLTPVSIASWPVGRSRNDVISQALRRRSGRITYAGDFTESTHSEGASYSADRALQDIQKTFAASRCQALHLMF